MRNALVKMPYADEMSTTFFVKKMSEDFKWMRTLFSNKKEHRQLLLDSPITMSLHLSGKNDAGFLYVIKDDNKVFAYKDILKNYKHSKFKSKGNIVYVVELSDEVKYTFAFYKDLILMSKYSYLVENGMKQLRSPAANLLNDNRIDYKNALTRNEDEVEVVVLFENLKNFSTTFLNQKATQQLEYFSKNISSGKWILKFQEEGVQVVGLLKSTDVNVLLGNDYSNQIYNSKVQNVLPGNIAYYFRNNIMGINSESENFEKEEHIFNKYFLPWLGEEWLTGRSEIFTRKMNAEKFFAFHTKDKKLAQHYLQKLSDSVDLVKSWTYQTYPIHQLNINALPIPFSNGEEFLMETPSYAIIDNYVVFSGAPRIIENWIDKHITNQTLAGHIPYLKMKNKARENDVLEFYWNQNKSERLVKNSFIAKDPKTQKQIELWKTFPAIGLNGKWKNDELVFNGYLFFEKEQKESTTIKWRLPLQANAATQPYSVFNTKIGAHQILIQDEDHRLYLINADGVEVWNILLEHPIQSEIKVKQFSEKGKEWIVFNTKEKIHLLDFKGENKTDFPIQLAASATNGLLLADFGGYDNGIFIACSNHFIYGFKEDASPFSGWNALESKGNIEQPLQHFQTENKDYIIALNTEGDIFSFDKNGFKTIEGSNIAFTSSSPLCFQMKNNNDAVIANHKGEPQVIALEGEDISVLQKGKKSQRDLLFAANDFGGSPQTDFVTLENNQLQIFYHHKNKFEASGNYKFSNPQNSIFAVQTKTMNKAMIGTLCKEQSQIYLLDKKGNLHDDFPLAGTTEFELVHLFSDDKKVVLVADGNQVVTYELSSF